MRYFPYILGCVMAALASPAAAQSFAPSDLEGHWGTPEQCAAQAEVGPDGTVTHVRDAPYRFEGHWLSRWFFYCRIMEVFPLEDGHRVRALCGSDAVERPWEIDVTRDGSSINMSWAALGEDAFVSPPWEVGPLQMCSAEQS